MSTRLLDIYAEGVRHQMGQSSVQNALRDLVNDLARERIDYMLIGALALFAHGYARFTTDIDLVLTPEDLARFRERLEGRGYVPKFTGARKGFRATDTNTPVEIRTAGENVGAECLYRFAIGSDGALLSEPPAVAGGLRLGTKDRPLPQAVLTRTPLQSLSGFPTRARRAWKLTASKWRALRR